MIKNMSMLELENNVNYYDITPIVHEGIAVFPGDTAYKNQFLLDMKKGDSLTLSKIECTVHLGAHTDAPCHYSPTGVGIGERPLNYYLGRAQVIDVTHVMGPRVLLDHIESQKITAPRVLFKTNSFLNPYEWHNHFKALSGELVDFLAQQGVRLVGIDTPSIDPANDKELESHQAVFRHDMAILEGILLQQVPVGEYTLIALPLRLAGSDASPVRAILIR